MNKKKKILSHSDIPKSNDELGIEKYTDGLSKFITHCSTPLTLAIQGDWGTGKTSLMKIVEKKIENKQIKTIWFNTWQYSQFKMDDSIAIHLISNLFLELTKDKSKQREILSNLMSLLSNIVAHSDLSNLYLNAEKISETIDNFVSRNSGLVELKSKFQSAVNESKYERVVIFIDDLDRLEPIKAIELMEIIKLFLDCEKCVFVLAIDYGIVLEGIKDKYGEVSQEKGKEFFDKLIQVPFQVPVRYYDIEKYLTEIFTELNIEVDDMKTCVKFVKRSVGSNPRSLKRLINSYILNNTIRDAASHQNNKLDLALFVSVCMQMKFEQEFSLLEDDREFYIENLLSLDDEFEEHFAGFASLLKEYCSKDSFCEDFKRSIELSYVTSVGDVKENTRTLGENQEEAWIEFKNYLDSQKDFNTLENYSIGAIGKYNFLYFNSKDSAKLFELSINKRSLRVLYGISNKKKDKWNLKEKLEKEIDSVIDELENRKDCKDCEIQLINNTNYTGIAIVNRNLGLDLVSDDEEIFKWLLRQIKILSDSTSNVI